MLSYYSILKFVNNPRTGEFISLGLVSVGYPHVYFKVSTRKLSLAYSLSPNVEERLQEAFVQMQSFIPIDLGHMDALIQFRNELDLGFLHNLSLYREGCLQFSRLDFIDMPMDAALFQVYFDTYITSSYKVIVDFKSDLELKV